MASSPNTSWQIEKEKVEDVTDFIFLDSKITADSDCSHEIKRHLLPGRKAMTNLENNGYEFEQDGEGQGSLVCCSPWGRKASTEGLNNI